MTAEETWLTVEQVAEMAQVHPDTARRWMREGDLPARNLGGKTGYRVRKSEVIAFLDAVDAGPITRGRANGDGDSAG